MNRRERRREDPVYGAGVSDELTIRAVTEEDVETLFGLILELASYEKLSDEVSGDAEVLAHSLFEDVIPKQYELVEGLPFRYRVPQKEREILARYVTPMITREYQELVKRYGFTPKGPLIMELFSDPSHYAVRTVGLPGLEPR